MTTMQAWNYSSAQGGLAQHLQLRSDVAKPADGSSLKANEVLVETHAVALNPADYKVPGFPILGKLIYPSIPGTDYSGRVAAVHSANTTFRVGQEVFGRVNVYNFGKKKNGVLAQYLVADTEELAAIPEGLNFDDAAAIGTAGLTAFDALQLGHLRDKHVFINGGSGGTGIFTIQIAKTLGAIVTTTCSTENVALCKELGADEVIDYKVSNVLDVLKSGGQVFDYAIDNVGQDLSLLKQSHTYLKPKADYIQVGGSGSVIAQAHAIALAPCLRMGKNPVTMVAVKQSSKNLTRVARWISEGEVKVVIDSTYSFEDTPKAFEKLQTGRAKGKIIVHVKEQKTTSELTTEKTSNGAAEPTLNDKEIAAESSIPVSETAAAEEEPTPAQITHSADDAAKSEDDFKEAQETSNSVAHKDATTVDTTDDLQKVPTSEKPAPAT